MLQDQICSLDFHHDQHSAGQNKYGLNFHEISFEVMCDLAGNKPNLYASHVHAHTGLKKLTHLQAVAILLGLAMSESCVRVKVRDCTDGFCSSGTSCVRT